VKIGEMNVILLWKASVFVDLGKIRYSDPNILPNFLENWAGNTYITYSCR